MQTASQKLIDALNNGHVNKALPRLIVEWNQNRYAGILKVDNDPSDNSVGADIENFPIDTIVEAQRPKRGIIKARASKARSIPLFWSRQRNITTGEEGFTAEDYSDTPSPTRYYTVGPSAGYKYWTSPMPSTYTQEFNGSYRFPAGYEVRPYVLYKTSARSNKIVVTFESSWARPVDYQIQTTIDGGNSWQTIASNILPNDEGQVILYRHANGSWDQNIDRDAVGNLNGIRLIVTSINRPDAHLNLIELSPRLESDLSEYVVSYESTSSMSEANFLTPLGQASSNTASFNISNLDGLFNNENQNSIYYKLVDKNAKATMDLIYSFVDGTTETVREFTMYVDQWGDGTELELQATLKDSSKFFQEEKVPSILFENVTVGEAVWRICDSIGFHNFIYDRKESDPSSSLPYFWTDGENTVWEALQQLAEATQTAIYFDEFDVLRIKTREAAYDLAKSPTWALEATDTGGKLADVVEAQVVADYEANIVNVNYKDTKVSDDNKGFPEMHVLWQPEETFVLRSSQLIEGITPASTVVRIDAKEVATWPYEGMFNIEGELIKYDAKEYTYYSKSGQLTTVWVNSLEDKNNIDKTLTDENQAFKSTWTGRLRVKERGVYWSSPRGHVTDIQGWNGRTAARNSPSSTNYQGGIGHNVSQSLLRLNAPGNAGPDSLYVATRGNTFDQNYRRYGTRLRIPKNSRGNGAAGIVINSGDGESGYYVELVPTETMNANGGALRRFIQEVSLLIRHPNGAMLRLAGRGTPALIATDVWYDLDVDFYEEANGNHNIVVYLNGIALIRADLASGRVIKSGRFGVHKRGTGGAEFEYFFAHAGGEEYKTDEVSQFDKTRGGYVSGQWDREFVYGTRDANRRVGNRNIAYKQKYNQYFMDEFGPIVHEVREMDISFEKFPVLHSRLYVSNDSQIVTPEYNADSFGAKFMLANSSRDNAVGNGQDTLRFGAENPVEQKMMIYGRLIFQEEGQLLTVKNKVTGQQENPYQNDDSIRRRGKVEVNIDSKWIQSKAEAQALGDWILKHWSNGNEEVQVEVYGNPLFQLSDVVSLDYPKKNMARATHRYFITGIRNSFDTGLSTQLTLRRAKN